MLDYRSIAAGLVLALGWPIVSAAQPYVSAELGYANADFNIGAPYNGIVDDRRLAWGFNAGLGVSEHVAVEFGFRGYRDFEGRGVPCAPGGECPPVVVELDDNSVRSYRLSIVPHTSVGAVQLFGEVGYYYSKIDTNIGLPGDRFDMDGLVIGGGARWLIRDPLSVSIRAARLDDNLYEFSVGIGWGAPLRRDVQP